MYFQVLRRPRFIEFCHSPKNVTLICGVPRSGTTWVGNVVAEQTRSRILFEPFITGESCEFMELMPNKGFDLSKRKEYPLYFHDIRQDETLLAGIEKILFGYKYSHWSNQDLVPGIYFGRVIKEIRVNLILHEIAEIWSDLKIVYLVRSPFKVIDSMIGKAKVGWLFEWTIEDIIKNEALVKDFIEPYLEVIEDVKTLPQRLMLRWCIENSIALRMLKGKSNVMIISYEELQRIKAWSAIGSFLSDRGWHGMPTEELLNRPSRTTSDVIGGRGKAGYKYLADSDVEDIYEMIHAFDLSETLGRYAAGPAS